MSHKVPMLADTHPEAPADVLFKGDRLKGYTRDMATAMDVREGRRQVRDMNLLLPCNVPIVEARRQLFLANRYDRSKPADLEELVKRHKEAANSPEKYQELAAYRIFEMTNDVMPTPFAMSAFQTVNLSANELPMIVTPRSRNLQHFSVYAHSIYGGSRMDQWRSDMSLVPYEMEIFRTDKVQSPIMDLQIGRVGNQDLIQQTLEFDKAMKIDATALAALDAIQVSSGLRALLNFHSSVNQTNVPDKNYLDLQSPTYGTPGKLTIEKIKAILKHLVMFGAAYPDQAMQIRSVHLSPQHLSDCWDFVDLVAGWDTSGAMVDNPASTVTTPVREQIFNTGMMTSAWGYNWSWSPNSQLAPGRMYIFTNQPVGWMFTKTEFDKMIKWDDTNSPKHAEFNLSEIELTWTMKFILPELWKYRVLMVDF